MLNRYAYRLQSTVSDIISNFQPLSGELNRISTAWRSMFQALSDPTNGQHLSTYAECTSYYALQALQTRMLEDPVGSLILQEKPRIRTWSFDFASLENYPKNTLGYQYWEFLKTRGFHPDERPIVKHIGDLELAYIFQWYKETHDFLHVVLNKHTSIIRELEIKWFEFEQLGLSSCASSSLFGSLLLPIDQKIFLFSTSGPEMIRLAKKSKLFLNIYFHKHLDQDIDEFRKYFFND